MTDAEIVKTMKTLRWIARFMDNGWGIPFTKFRFGVDAFEGLFPIGGDVLMSAVSIYLVIKAWEMGAPRPLLGKMLLNVGIEAGLGALPVVGGILDVLFMANVKNMDLLADFIRQKGIAID